MIIVLGKPVGRWACIYDACGAKCCRMEREITPSDVRRIVRATGSRVEDFALVSDEDATMPFKLKRMNGKCAFLLDDQKCRLHDLDAKPVLCQMYPFLIHKITYGDEPIMEIDPVPECPGYGVGPPLSQEALDQIKKKGHTFMDEVREVVRAKRRGKRPREIIEEALGRP